MAKGEDGCNEAEERLGALRVRRGRGARIAWRTDVVKATISDRVVRELYPAGLLVISSHGSGSSLGGETPG